MRIKALMMILLAMGCGIVATMGVSQVEDRPNRQAAVIGGVKLFVADVSIKAGERFTPQNVRLETWPSDRVPDGAITRLEDLQHRFAQRALSPGEALRRRYVLDSTRASMVIPETVHTPADESVPKKEPDESVQKTFSKPSGLRGVSARPAERSATAPQPFVVHISMSVEPAEEPMVDSVSGEWRRTESNLASPRSSAVTGTFLMRDPHLMPRDEIWQGEEVMRDPDPSQPVASPGENSLNEQD